jgi:hypothetical protein
MKGLLPTDQLAQGNRVPIAIWRIETARYSSDNNGRSSARVVSAKSEVCASVYTGVSKVAPLATAVRHARGMTLRDRPKGHRDGSARRKRTLQAFRVVAGRLPQMEYAPIKKAEHWLRLFRHVHACLSDLSRGRGARGVRPGHRGPGGRGAAAGRGRPLRLRRAGSPRRFPGSRPSWTGGPCRGPRWREA